MRLLIVSHVVHYRFANALWAYGPYAREIDLWADLFSEVVIAAPLREERPPGDCCCFGRSNVSIAPQEEAGGETISAKLNLLFRMPCLVATLCREMIRADAIHVRCPGNLGLLGALLAPLFSGYRVAKYAGQWGAYPGEAVTYRWQRAILASRWWRAPVTVYGHWPDQPSHVVPFFTSVLSEDHLERARIAARRKITHPGTDARPEIVFVGRLSRGKNVDVLLRALAQVPAPLYCTVLGDGPERGSLEKLARDLGLGTRVRFAGAVSFDDVLRHLEYAGVLVLASQTEGWPKSIVEAMAFGLVCIGSSRGIVPQILNEGRGFVVEPRNVDELAAILGRIAACPGEFVEMRARAAEWAQNYSLNRLRTALRDLLSREWNIDFPVPESLPPLAMEQVR